MRRVYTLSSLFLIAILVALPTTGCGEESGDEERTAQNAPAQNENQANDRLAQDQDQGQAEAKQTQQKNQAADQQEKPEETAANHSYSEILTNLKDAALSGGTYNALSHSHGLNPPEKETLKAFCETVWQLEINSELDRLERDAYMVGRIRNLAEFDLPGSYSDAVGTAMDELIAMVDLAALDAKQNHNYKKACYQ